MPVPSANPQDDEAQPEIDEWRVDAAGPTGATSPAAPPEPSEWSKGNTTRRSARVREDLDTWTRELNERVRRLEERIAGTDSQS